jgi:hypothetical protein
VTERKLGRRILPQDRRALWLFDYWKKKLPPAPKEHDNSKLVSVPWQMYRNDEYGDCVFASAGNGIVTWTANNADKVHVPPVEDILSAYSAVTGFDPNDSSTDNGTDPLDALKYWRKTGISGRKIGAWVQCNAKRPEQLRQTIYRFDYSYMALALPAAAGDMDIWDLPKDKPIEGASWSPGSWGGHMVIGVKYDERGVWLVTWGQMLLATWAFLAAYCDLPFAIISTDILSDKGVSAHGLDLKALEADLKMVAKQ